MWTGRSRSPGPLPSSRGRDWAVWWSCWTSCISGRGGGAGWWRGRHVADLLPGLGRNILQSQHATAPKSGVVAAATITLNAVADTRTHRVAISAWPISCSATGPSSSSTPGRSSATSSCFGPCPNSRPSWRNSAGSVASSCSIRLGSGCRTRSRVFARWMIERPRSRPSWTPSASERPSSSV